MRVIESKPYRDVIELDRLKEKLEEGKGILVWKFEGKIHLIKNPKYTGSYRWVSCFYDTGHDNNHLTVSSVSDLIKFIKELLKKEVRNEFYYFERYEEFINWIKETQ